MLSISLDIDVSVSLTDPLNHVERLLYLRHFSSLLRLILLNPVLLVLKVLNKLLSRLVPTIIMFDMLKFRS